MRIAHDNNPRRLVENIGCNASIAEKNVLGAKNGSSPIPAITITSGSVPKFAAGNAVNF
jgi:hypothetical protein